MAPDDDESGEAKTRLHSLEERLKKARGARPGPEPQARPSKLGMAFRLSTELVAAVVVGGGIGWGLDRLAGTKPFFLIAMFFVGVAAGFLNVIRAAREMNNGS